MSYLLKDSNPSLKELPLISSWGFLRAATIYTKQKLQDNSSSQARAIAAILISQLGICDRVASCETGPQIPTQT